MVSIFFFFPFFSDFCYIALGKLLILSHFSQEQSLQPRQLKPLNRDCVLQNQAAAFLSFFLIFKYLIFLASFFSLSFFQNFHFTFLMIYVTYM